jgi:hypothetical protein
MPFIALNPPTGLAAFANSAKVTLNWTSPGGPISSFTVYRGASATSLSPLGTSTNQIFEDTSVISGSIYCYKVSALNADNESILTDAITIHVPFPAPVPVSGNVIDQNSNCLAGVTVSLENGTSVRTDGSGNFLIMANQGSHTLTLSGGDIETRKIGVEIGASGSALGSIKTTRAGNDIIQIILVAGIIAAVMFFIAFLLVRQRDKTKDNGNHEIQIVFDMNRHK